MSAARSPHRQGQIEGEDGPAAAARALGARIRSLRQSRGMTLTQMAAEAELSHSFLSQVERGLERMSMTSLFRVAQALGTSQQALLTDDTSPVPPVEESFHVYRASESTALDAGGSPVRVLARDHPRFVPMVMSGEFEEDMWWVHDEEEFIYVLDGRLTVMIEDQQMVIDPGDAVYYHGGVRHRWRTEPGEPVQVLVVKEGRAGGH